MIALLLRRLSLLALAALLIGGVVTALTSANTVSTGHAGSTDVVVTQAASSCSGYANSGSITDQFNEGAINFVAGDYVAVGFDFTIAGSHPLTNLCFSGVSFTIPYTCPSGGGTGGNITVPVASTTYTDPLNSSSWYPSDAPNYTTFQGVITAPNGCSGNQMRNSTNATAVLHVGWNQASVPASSIHVRLHYIIPNPPVDCSNPASNPSGAAPCNPGWSNSNIT